MKEQNSPNHPFLSITTLSLVSLLCVISTSLAEDIWYDSQGTPVKVGKRYLSEFESYSLQRKLSAQNASSEEIPQALPLSPVTEPAADTPPLQTQPTNTKPSLLYTPTAHLPSSRRYGYGSHAIHPASLYHYNPYLYRSPSFYQHNYYRPHHPRRSTGGLRRFYSNINGHRNWGLGYFRNGVSIQVVR